MKNKIHSFMIFGAVSCALTLTAFADTTQNSATPTTATVPADQSTTTAPAATTPAANATTPQANSNEECAKKICSKDDFGNVTCKCPTK